MAKIEQLETVLQTLARSTEAVQGCAVVSRQGQGDVLYELNMGGIDRAFLSTVISSLLLIGEKLGHELNGQRLDYTLAGYAESLALTVPCNEDVALMAVLNDSGIREPLIQAAREAAREIGAVLRNGLAET